MEGVVACIDGLNLYYGIGEKGGPRYLRSDLRALATSLFATGQSLLETKDFTAHARVDAAGPAPFPSLPRSLVLMAWVGSCGSIVVLPTAVIAVFAAGKACRLAGG